MTRSLNLHSRRKLKPRDAARFVHEAPPLFAELAQAVCETGMLPHKELHECWQMAEVVHRIFPDIPRVADIAAGHGLLAWILVLMARAGDKPFPRTAVAVDINRPRSADILAASISRRWPDLAGTVHYVEGSAEAVRSDQTTLFVAAHACGSLSDHVLLAALRSRSPLAIMPCCHSLRKQRDSLLSLAELSGLATEWPDLSQADAAVGPSAAIDEFRKAALTNAGYAVQDATIQPEITAFHRIILARPCGQERDASLTQTLTQDRVPVKRSGEVRAFEKVQTLNVADIKETEALSRRPSREWIRFFDLSFWVKDEASGRRLHGELDRLMSALSEQDQNPWQTMIIECDQYWNSATLQLAFTYRVEVRSASVPIEKGDALRLRKQLCLGLESLSQTCPGLFTLRGA